MNRFKALALVGALSLGFVSPAMAAISASASVSSFTVTLYDLDMTDGIAPTITWSDPYGYALTRGNYTNAYVYEIAGSPSNISNWAARGSSNTSIASNSHASVTASVGASSSELTPSGLVSVSGSAYATSTSGYTTFSASANDLYNSINSFVLSAHSAVVFSAATTTYAATTVGFDWEKGQTESVNASVELSVRGTGASGTGTQYAYDSNSSAASFTQTGSTVDPVTYNYIYHYLPQSASSSATLAGAFMNTSSSELTGQVQLYANAFGHTSVVAVPEPETYAMFLAGLGIIGAMAGRRQSC